MWSSISISILLMDSRLGQTSDAKPGRHASRYCRKKGRRRLSEPVRNPTCGSRLTPRCRLPEFCRDSGIIIERLAPPPIVKPASIFLRTRCRRYTASSRMRTSSLLSQPPDCLGELTQGLVIVWDPTCPWCFGGSFRENESTSYWITQSRIGIMEERTKPTPHAARLSCPVIPLCIRSRLALTHRKPRGRMILRLR